MRIARVGLLLLVTTLTATPGPGLAQAWIGQIAGDMAAQAEQARLEAACRQGQPASEKTQAWASQSSEAALAGYVALGPDSKPSALKKVFALNKPDTSWKGPDGPVPFDRLPAQLEARDPTLSRVAFVVGGDGTTARGIWKASWSDQPDRTAWYAIDFVGSPAQNIWGGGSYRIWHFTLFTGSEAPPAPAAYCHFDADQAW